MAHTVLFVDDEQSVLESIRRSLHREPYTVETANGGADALEKIKTTPPSVIITDMRMPVMDGIAFLNEAQKIRPAAMYMVLSAYADIEKIMEAINERHVWRYITKPWQKEDLRLAVQTAIEMFEHREAKKELLGKLERQNTQLKDLNNILEEKVRERTQRLQEKNEILQMLVEDADMGKIMEKICKAIAGHLHTSPIFIDVPFLERIFSDGSHPLPAGLAPLRETAIKGKREIIDGQGAALPLLRNGVLLGTLFIANQNRAGEVMPDDSVGGHVSVALLCLMQAWNLRQTPGLTDAIDRIVGAL